MLVLKHSAILQLTTLEPTVDASNITFVQAYPDTIHTEFFNSYLGHDVNTPNNPFVDDTIMADSRRHILTTMATSIEPVYIILGRLDKCSRRFPITMVTFAAFKRSWANTN